MALQDDPARATARALAAFIDASPTPFHACATAAGLLSEAGFTRLAQGQAWDGSAGARFVWRAGSLIAWLCPPSAEPARPFRILGAHTDSPNLRVKPRPDGGRAGCRQLSVEVYGGVLHNSWLDRDLGLAGRVWLAGPEAPGATSEGTGSADPGSWQGRLFCIDRPILRLPQLAIHLDRSVNTDGLKLNPQTHMAPVLGLGKSSEGDFRRLLATELDVDPARIMGWDAMLHDSAPSRLIGVDEELLSAPRLDNLCSCHAALSALIERKAAGALDGGDVSVVVLFDHEEIGSTSERGAGGPFLRDLLERTVLARGGGREDFLRALSRSSCVSADMAHATHPNYVDRHEPNHLLEMNAGPVIKINTSLRYASESETEALFQRACERAGVPYQKYVNRTDLACGSTIGPITAASLGVRTVDVGCAQLAMHSARELCGALDPAMMIRAMVAFLA